MIHLPKCLLRYFLKRKIVKKNNLNWKEFFNVKQFNDWYDKEKSML